MYSVKVPTKAYLRKYVYARYGHPLKLNYTTTIGTMILCLVSKEYFDINMNTIKKDVRLSHMNDEIELVAPLGTMKYKGHSITPDKIIAINRYFENSFVEELYNYCRDNIEKRAWRPGINKAINSFCDQYGIEVEEDISFEALKKAESRYRKKIEENIQTFVPRQNKPSQFTFFPAFSPLHLARIV
jgi:hypothetical protein